MKNLKVKRNPLLILLIDGMGIGLRGNTNPVSLARTPNLNRLWRESWHDELHASGTPLGLESDQASNTRTSLRIFGSGRKHESLKNKVNAGLTEGNFIESPLWGKFWQNLHSRGGTLHFVGKFSLAHQSELGILLHQAANFNINPGRIAMHLIADKDFTMETLMRTNGFLEHHRLQPIVSIVGSKFITSHSPVLFQVTKHHLMEGKSHKIIQIQNFFQKFISPTDIEPAFFVSEESNNVASIKPQDSVVFFDTDSAEYHHFIKQLRSQYPELNILQLATSHTDRQSALYHIFKPEKLLPQILSEAEIMQTNVAETSKFAEVSSDLKWGSETLLPGEKAIEIPFSDQANLESNHALLFAYIERELKARTGVIWANLSLLDYYGHKGDTAAITAAAEYLDDQIGKLMDVVKETHANVIVLSDHGNSELMYDEDTGSIHTEHTLNKVPLIIHSPKTSKIFRKSENSSLIDIAPTILDMLNLEAPLDMEGQSLLI